MRYKVYVIQALLAVNRRTPHWADVAHVAVNGWRVWENHSRRVIGYHGDRFWTDVLAFHDEATGLQCLADVRTVRQDFTLRLIERVMQKTEREVIAAPSVRLPALV